MFLLHVNLDFFNQHINKQVPYWLLSHEKHHYFLLCAGINLNQFNFLMLILFRVVCFIYDKSQDFSLLGILCL